MGFQFFLKNMHLRSGYICKIVDQEQDLLIFVTVVKRNGQLVKLEFYQSVVRLFVYHSSRL